MLAAAVVAACAAPSRVLTTSVGAASVQPTDIDACGAEASTVEWGRTRETRYAACMIARGYSATVDVMPPSAIALFVPVSAPTAGEPTAVVAAIEECRAVVVARLTPPPPPPPTGFEKFVAALLDVTNVAFSLARRDGSYVPYDSTPAPRGPGFGILGRSNAREVFKGCMEGQQYRVSE